MSNNPSYLEGILVFFSIVIILVSAGIFGAWLGRKHPRETR
jgi:hypothetical protein